MRVSGKSRIFASYFGSYLLALCIPVIICSVAYKIANDNIAANIQRYNTVSLNLMLNQIDSSASEIQDVSYRVANDMLTLSASVLDRQDRGALAGGMTQYVKQLWPVWVTSKDCLFRMYVYFSRSREVASPFTFYDAEDFYGTFFEYDDMNADEFYSSLTNRKNNINYLPPSPVLINDIESASGRRMAVLFIRQIIPQTTGNPVGAVFTLIDSSWIQKRLSDILPAAGGYGAVLDSVGNVVAEAGAPADFTREEIEGFRTGSGTSITGKNIVVRTVSQQNGWKYVAAGRKSVLMAEVNTIIELSIAIISLAVVLGAAVCAWLANAKARPVARLTGLFSADAAVSAADSFHMIEAGIGHIMASNRLLTQKMEQHKPLLAAVFFQRLFSGHFIEEDAIPAIAGDMGLAIEGKAHVAVVTRVKAGRLMLSRGEIVRLGYMKKLVHDALEAAAGHQVYAMDPSLSEIAWLFSAQSGDGADNALAAQLLAASETLRKQGVECLFAVGSPVEALSDAYKSYREALSAADWEAPSPDIPIVWYWNLRKAGERYEYRLDTEELLIRFIRGGDREAVRSVLQSIRAENLEGRSLTSSMKTMLIGEMFATLLKVQEHSRSNAMEQLWSELQEIADLDSRFDSLCKAIEDNCTLYTVQRQSSSHQLALRIKEFVQSHFSNSDLGLKMVSVETGISEAYLSRVFKESMDENFAAYVERIRIEEACKRLSNPSCSVAAVAQAVGYNSDHVFRRAFKRVVGMSPVEYRHGLGLD